MALSRTTVRQLAIAAGALLVGALAGSIWRAYRAKPATESGAGTASSAAQPDASAASSAFSPMSSSSTAVIHTPGSQVYDIADDPNFKAGVALRPMDRDIFAALVDPNLDRSHLVDVFPDKPYRVRFLGSVSEHWIGLIQVDLDRDGIIDERWKLGPSEVDRFVLDNSIPLDSGLDPDKRGTHFKLRRGRWQAR